MKFTTIFVLQDDPTVYQYDEVYDDMKQTKQNQILESKKDKTSKYAKSLIRNAALRKLENDRFLILLRKYNCIIDEKRTDKMNFKISNSYSNICFQD